MTGTYREEMRFGGYTGLSFVALLLVAMASVGSSRQAVAQVTSAAAPNAAGTEVAPRGQREARDIGYGDWRKLCFKPGGAKMLCRTSITGTFATGQMAVRVDIIERDGDGSARLQLFAPVGMYLPAGVKVTVDQGTPYRVPYNWCLTNTCIAADVPDPKMLLEMAAGQTLRLEFVDSNLLSLTTSLPLARFASVRRDAPAQTFEQDIDE